MNNIFLFGKGGCGKDTVAKILEEEYGYMSLALADPIREEYKRFFGTDDHRNNRPKMIEIGQTYKTIYSEDIWCELAMQTISFANKRTVKNYRLNGWVIRDGRYPHEYDYFINKGFVPVRLISDLDVRYKRLLKRDGTAQKGALELEAAMFISDYAPANILVNNGTLDELRQQIDELVKVAL